MRAHQCNANIHTRTTAHSAPSAQRPLSEGRGGMLAWTPWSWLAAQLQPALL
jgi:hypothetical protein